MTEVIATEKGYMWWVSNCISNVMISSLYIKERLKAFSRNIKLPAIFLLFLFANFAITFWKARVFDVILIFLLFLFVFAGAGAGARFNVFFAEAGAQLNVFFDGAGAGARLNVFFDGAGAGARLNVLFAGAGTGTRLIKFFLLFLFAITFWKARVYDLMY
ncbi:hypothetical protein LCY76_14590 [Fictibacillus sp. KIGAM418]|uniref:Uncharacterized protein n=1 Tax=Fictibacillus marinisediminis TaxID=2878389 RepID=A0A9X1XDG6_9BACL|nr:hypothetical protein [Fictibacillus marinisediminis]MCK6257810.1 hypothetical protein [Fictibacillus marinisediminis]